MPAPLAAFGGSLAGQLGGQALSASGGNIFLGLEQWGNLAVQNGIIPYEQGRLLYTIGWCRLNSWDHFRRFHGMEGEALNQEIYQITRMLPNGLVDGNPERINLPLHINDKFNQMLKYTPTIPEVLLLLNRKQITPGLARIYINNQIGGEQALINSWMNMRYEIPGPSDLIRFAVRDAFSPQIVQQFEYHKEFPIHILPFMEMQGYGQTLPIAIPPGATNTNGPDNRLHPTWSDLYWWSHWELPSPTQAYMMLHRLYSESPHGPSPDYNVNNKFLDGDLELLLKAQDYPSYWRSRLTAISYNPLTRVDVRRMYDMYVLSESQVYHAYRAIGYNDLNAQLLTNWTKLLRTTKEQKKFKYISVKDIEENWDLQIFTTQETKDQLKSIGLQPDQIELTFKGFEFRKIKRQLHIAIRDAKKGYMVGIYDEDLARNVLTAGGISVERSNRFIGEWQLERMVNQKFLSASQNMELATNGIISEQEFKRRLRNLNYSIPEIDDMVLRVYQKIQTQFNKEAEKIKKAAEKRAKEEARETEKKTTTLLKPYTDINIKKWYKAKMLTLEEVITILKLREWKNEAIVNWIQSELNEEVELEEETTEEEKESQETESTR